MSDSCGCVSAIFRRETSKNRQTKKGKHAPKQDESKQQIIARKVTSHWNNMEERAIEDRSETSKMDIQSEPSSRSYNGEQTQVTSSIKIRLKRQRTMSDPDEEEQMQNSSNTHPDIETQFESSPEFPTGTVSEVLDDESSSASTNTGSTTIAVDVKTPCAGDDSLQVYEKSADSNDRVWSPSCQRKALKLDLSRFKSPDDDRNSPTTGGGTSPANTVSSTTSVREKWQEESDDPNPPVWQPFGAPVETPQFRSVKLETPPAKTPPPTFENSPPSSRKKEKQEVSSPKTPKSESPKPEQSDSNIESDTQRNAGMTTTTTISTSSWARTGRASNLPASQSPTITLLQKAREGQIPKGAIYIDEKSDSKAISPIPKDAILIDQKVTVEGDKIHTDSYYAVPASVITGESNSQILKAPKYDGIGPTECGIPVALRTAVKDEYASDWYKTMYRSLHKAPGDSRSHTQTVHLGGYMSEPEYDRKDFRRPDYATLDYRTRRSDHVPKTTRVVSPKETKTQSSIEKLTEEYLTGTTSRHQEHYKNQPRSIAEYEPGRSSLAEREFQKFWDDFWDSLDDLHEHFRLSPRPTPQHFSEKKWPNAILCDGYESDSTLIRKSGRPPPRLDPDQQKAWYKEIQKGGEIPFTGLRKLAPERPKVLSDPKKIKTATIQPNNFHQHSDITSSRDKFKSTLLKPHENITSSLPVVKPYSSPFSSGIQKSKIQLPITPPPTPPQRRSSKQILVSNSPRHFKFDHRLIPTNSGSTSYNITNGRLIFHPNEEHGSDFDNFNYISNPTGRYFIPNAELIHHQSAKNKESLSRYILEKRNCHLKSGTRSAYSIDMTTYPLEFANSCIYEQAYTNSYLNTARMCRELPLHYINGSRSYYSSSDKNEYLNSTYYPSHETQTLENHSTSKLSDFRKRSSFSMESFPANSDSALLFHQIEHSPQFRMFPDEKSSNKYETQTNDLQKIKTRCRFNENYVRFIDKENNIDSTTHLPQAATKKPRISSNHVDCVAAQSLKNQETQHVRHEDTSSKTCHLHSISYPNLIKSDQETLRYTKENSTSSLASLTEPLNYNSNLCFHSGSILPPSESAFQNCINIKRGAENVCCQPEVQKRLPVIANRSTFLKPFLMFPQTNYNFHSGEPLRLDEPFEVCKNRWKPVEDISVNMPQTTLKNEKIANRFPIRNQVCEISGAKISQTTIPNTAKNVDLKKLFNVVDIKKYLAPQISQSDYCEYNLAFLNSNGYSMNVLKNESISENKRINTNYSLSNGKNAFKFTEFLAAIGARKIQEPGMYHQYMTAVLHSITRSNAFLKLRNFYNKLENCSSSNNVEEFTKRCIPRWQKEQDRNLRVRHSSVEDLRQYFQNPTSMKSRRSQTLSLTFSYRKNWYNISVSNLVERYNKIDFLSKSKHSNSQFKNAIGSSSTSLTPTIWKKFEFNRWKMERIPHQHISYFHESMPKPGVHAINKHFQTLHQSSIGRGKMHYNKRESKYVEHFFSENPRNSLNINLTSELSAAGSGNETPYIGFNVHSKIKYFERRSNLKDTTTENFNFSCYSPFGSNRLVNKSSETRHSCSNISKFTSVDHKPFRSRPLGISQSSSTFNVSGTNAKVSPQGNFEEPRDYQISGEKLKRNKSFCNLNDIEKSEADIHSDKFFNYFLPGYVPERTVSFTDLRAISSHMPLSQKMTNFEDSTEQYSSNTGLTSPTLLRRSLNDKNYISRGTKNQYEAKNFYLTHICTGNVAMTRQKFESMETLSPPYSPVYRTQSLSKSSHFSFSPKDTKTVRTMYGVEWNKSMKTLPMHWKSVQKMCEKFEDSNSSSRTDCTITKPMNKQPNTLSKNRITNDGLVENCVRSRSNFDLELFADHATDRMNRSFYSSSPELIPDHHFEDLNFSEFSNSKPKILSNSSLNSTGARIRSLIARFEKQKFLKNQNVEIKQANLVPQKLKEEFLNHNFYKTTQFSTYGSRDSNLLTKTSKNHSACFVVDKDIINHNIQYVDTPSHNMYKQCSNSKTPTRLIWHLTDENVRPSGRLDFDGFHSSTIKSPNGFKGAENYEKRPSTNTVYRKPTPSRISESHHQYQESEVNIHFKSPIRNLEKEYIEEEELRKRQEEAMRKFYVEERQKKQLREAAELEMRRHCDFFTPSQKSPIPLNRYDNPFESNFSSKSRSPGPDYPRTLAQAIHPFVAQTNRELSLNKGDIVYINKQIDRNWYEGEHHGFVGIFPVSYVMVIPTERANLQPRKATEGHGVAKHTFRAKTPVELSLFKGERVVLMRRVDQNWYEGRVGAKKGIFPGSYIEVLQEPGDVSVRVDNAISPKPPASPVYSPILNGSPPPKTSSGPTYVSGAVPLHDTKLTDKTSITQSLHVDTYNEPIPYRSLYSYHPQNEDELELREGDTVYVMEKCDDGWYVGTSLRSGLFGTFPGNYVERI